MKARFKKSGIHNVMNAMAACAGVLSLGFSIEEMQKGYTLHGRVIRPSMVIVSKGKGGK